MKTTMPYLFVAAAALTLCLTGCVNQRVTAIPATDFNPVEPSIPIVLPAGTNSHSVLFKTLSTSITKGTVIGAIGIGPSCTPKGIINITPGPTAPPAPVWARPFYKELKTANYAVLSDPDNLFEDKTAFRPDYFVGVTIKRQKENTCFPGGVINYQTPNHSELSLDVEWQIYDTRTNNVVLTVPTHAYAISTVAALNDHQTLFETAVDYNVRALLANSAFSALMNGDKTGDSTAPQTVSSSPTQIKGAPLFNGPITSHVTSVQAGVVTILIGAGHGSGFVISNTGYVLTDSHVVGGANNVKLRMANGQEMTADVLKVDREHDVALLKARDRVTDVLPISITPVSVGGEVYAIGSPLSQKLAASVSKGVVSGYRNLNGVTHIQSDVSIQPGSSGGPLLDSSGNVVGLARSSLTRGTSTTGINMFIPIGQALQSVGVELRE